MVKFFKKDLPNLFRFVTQNKIATWVIFLFKFFSFYDFLCRHFSKAAKYRQIQEKEEKETPSLSSETETELIFRSITRDTAAFFSAKTSQIWQKIKPQIVFSFRFG